MDFNREIILACEAGIKELEAIKDYSIQLGSTQSEAMKKVYTDNRMDELPHIQNITVALTALLGGEEPDDAAKVDGEDEPPDEKPESEPGEEPNPDGKPGGGEDG